MENTSEKAAATMSVSFLPSSVSSAWKLDLTTLNLTSVKNDNSSGINSTSSPPPFFPCNNPENLIDQATARQVRAVLYMSVLAFAELFGIITNIINCVVFARQGLKDRINLCLFSLALADVSFLVLIFSAKFFGFLGLFDKQLADYWEKKHLETVLGPMSGALVISNLMTMIISVERCICVVSPFTAKKFLKTRYMAVIIVVMVLYILSFYGLQTMEYRTVQITDHLTNSTRWVIRFSDFYLDNKAFLDILYSHLLIFTIPSISLAVVIITTSITVFRLKKTLAWRQRSSNDTVSAGERREATVTRMLVVISLIYVTTITPSVTQAILRKFLPGYMPAGKYCNTFDVVQTLAHVCEVTNSSINFIVYFTMGSRFRDTLRQLFGTRGQQNDTDPTAQSAPPSVSVSQKL